MNNLIYELSAPFYSIEKFLSLEERQFLETLIKHHRNCMNESPSDSQIIAWQNCFRVLQNSFSHLIQKFYKASYWTIIFEYELLRERGRRPDVLILADALIFVEEFKDFNVALQAHIDQVAAYARDIQNYHSGSHERVVLPLLVLTKATQMNEKIGNIWNTSSDTLENVICELFRTQNLKNNSINPNDWIRSDYVPLPALVDAARTIFKHQPLPSLKRAQSAGIPDTIKVLMTIAKNAQEKSEHHLALVTGVPGSGKTLVGIQFVYENDIEEVKNNITAVFLSGNGPLVRVLQYALGSKVFVQDVHGFLKQYGGSKTKTPNEHIFVYDEAQRAWDKERVNEKRGYDKSEPEDFLHIGSKKSWSLMVGLIGEGQEIYLGEESGLVQWNQAIKESDKSWIVHCPEHVANIFTNAKRIEVSGNLNLTTSLRTHVAEDLQEWVEQVLNGNIDNASILAKKLSKHNFDLYITRDLKKAKNYVYNRYQDYEDKRYGLIASSKGYNLQKYGIPNGFYDTKKVNIEKWFIDPPTSPFSCCQLTTLVTEFGCQGLELDFPILCWGNDLSWDSQSWKTPKPRKSEAQDPHKLRINSYRVLLTRGRDGFIVYLPPENEMDKTFQVLLKSGLIEQ
jgi:DUF2075 family protein